MIEGIVKKIMTTGIEKYAKIFDTTPQDVQIRITDNPQGTVNYEICKGFQIVEPVTFLQIMNRIMDVFQYEALSSPYMKQSLITYAHSVNAPIENVCAFMTIHEKTIGISFYNEFTNTRNVLLPKFLEEVGLQ